MTRSTAGPTGAPSSGCRVPVSRRPAGWRTSTGRRQLLWIAGCWTPFSTWSSWTSTSTYCWWDRPVSARASWPSPGLCCYPLRPYRALQPRRQLIQGHVPSQGGQLRGPDLPVLPVPRPAHSGRPEPAPAHCAAVRRPLRTHPQPAPVVQLRHDQQPGRGRVAEPL